MDTEALRWFQQVADGVTVTEVGEMYWVTQSGVSRGLARLEAEVGTPLLRRSGRTLRMTRAGAVFKRYVDVVLHGLDDGLAAVGQLIDPATGTVALSSMISHASWLVPHLIGRFRTTYPAVQFALAQVRDESVPSPLGDGQTDLEITAVRPTDRTLRWHRLFTEPLCVAVRPTHRLAGRAQVALDEVATEPFVTLRPASLLRRQGDELCRRAGFRPVVALEADDLPTVRGMVAADLGVAIVPAPRAGSVESAPTALHHLSITDPSAVRDVGLVWPTERRLLPAAELFRQFVIDRATAGDLPPLA